MTVNGTADLEEITKDDAAWVITNAVLILTMQSGFGLLEAGSVSYKNVANIMIKNVVDVTCGGLSYWALGYGLSCGSPATPFFGYGNFFVTAPDERSMGTLYTHYVFQLSFATAATTIVSGAVAERIKFKAYISFSVLNTFIYCLPACWAWHDVGFLRRAGFFDFAGGCVVHATGGASALVAALMLGPRLGRFQQGGAAEYRMSSPVTALTGTFMLWWAWLGFNCGSTFGLSNGLWKLAAKVAVVTLNGSIAGGITGIVASYVVHGKHFDVAYVITSLLGGLVGVTAACAVITPAEALLVGAVGAAVALAAADLLLRLHIDDPVGAAPVHLVAGAWGTLAVGLFAKDELALLGVRGGLLRSGSAHLLGVQLLGCACIVTWAALSTAACLYALRLVGCLRVDARDEILGADWVEHRVRSHAFAARLEKALAEMSTADDAVNDVVRKVMSELKLGKTVAEVGDGLTTAGTLFTGDEGFPSWRTASNALADVAQRSRRKPPTLAGPSSARAVQSEQPA